MSPLTQAYDVLLPNWLAVPYEVLTIVILFVMVTTNIVPNRFIAVHKPMFGFIGAGIFTDACIRLGILPELFQYPQPIRLISMGIFFGVTAMVWIFIVKPRLKR